MAGVRQDTDSPSYQQGVKGYGERFGATAADGFSDITIGAAILSSLLHQDPRSFYQGTGSTGSRLRHAMLSPFVARGDDGKWWAYRLARTADEPRRDRTERLDTTEPMNCSAPGRPQPGL
jgi:hypothetical protein